jgi:hypothetical protein
MSRTVSFRNVFLGIVAVVMTLTSCTSSSPGNKNLAQLNSNINHLNFQAELDSLEKHQTITAADKALLLDSVEKKTFQVAHGLTYQQLLEDAKQIKVLLEESVRFEFNSLKMTDLDSSAAIFEVQYQIYNRLEKRISGFTYVIDFFDLHGDFIISTNDLEFTVGLNPLANTPLIVQKIQIKKTLANEDSYLLNVERLKSLESFGNENNIRFGVLKLELGDN